MTSSLRTADILARRLAAAGCRTAFGMPGGEVLTFVDALGAAGLRFVLVRHENAGGFMAEGVHHRDDAPGVLVATVGPGALNAVNVAENAREDRVPLIVVTGAVDTDTAARYTHQVLDQRAVFGAVCKASLTMVPGAAEAIADKAIAIATDGRPGPVHIDLPISVADAPAVEAAAQRRRPTLPLVPAQTPAFEAARAALAGARRPLIVAGVDAVNEGLTGLTATAEALGAPVITSYKAKGLIAEDHPLALGGAGLSPLADTHLLPLVREADAVILAGYDPVEMRIGWQDAFDPDAQTVIDISAVPNTHYMHQGSVNVHGAIGPTLAALTEGTGQATGWSGRIEEVRAALGAAFATGPDWGPAAVIDTCRRVLPRDALASADSGAHRILLSQMWRCFETRALVQSSGLCTMGCAVPLAMGMSLASPDRTVVSFSGDAGFLMVAGELATAADLGLRTIFVVFVDRSLALIELKQRQRQMNNAGVDFGRTDFAALGRAMGGQGASVASVADLEAALEAALAADTFTVIAAEIDRRAYDGRI
ncbi:thiamine pyrophosphate-binding protein [Roseivivax sediminis]|uniref:Acetolactate synthase-1/2/3 large subunit n=1 Tax=Roseivivax sediminis TaxID=936889 RepID=A0A1I2CF79_9RHOB|nr:thiamine pyrophosphate-binding protein [Roseivivax sediminis]SFE66340.1 acetolactate synthase-1/2/3 large subunit [Roseivivax sediminis]